MNGKILGILGLFVALCLFMTIATSTPWHSPGTSTFLKTGNLQNLLSRTALYGILGVGVAFVIITAGIDLSIGSMVCFSGVLLAIFLQVDYRPDHQSMVRSLDSETRQIRLITPIEGLEPGDRLAARCFGQRAQREPDSGRPEERLFGDAQDQLPGARLILAARPEREDSGA